MGQLGLNDRVSWLSSTDGALCFICKSETEDFNHFAFNCPNFREEFESLCSNLKNKVIRSNPLDGSTVAHFISNLAPQKRLQLLLGGLLLPFDNLTNMLITRFVPSALAKICKTGTEILCELELSPMDSF